MSEGKQISRAAPYINVTPLIDVLLVLLIIFMVVTPLKPSRFKVQIPEPLTRQPDQPPPAPDLLNLVVSIKEDGTLELNKTGNVGTVNETGKLSAELARIFHARLENHAYRWEMVSRPDLPEEARIQKTVFIKAPRSIAYGDVVKVLDGIKGAGAEPVGLQVDGLD